MTIALRQRPLARVVMGIVKSANGAWLDPSDMSTMFQDAAGTIPVTAVEQPVGLVLDKSQGLMLGPELVPQDYLTNPAAWSIINGTAQAVAGRIIFTANGAGQLAVLILTPVVLNKIVRTSLSISSFDSGLGSLYDYTSGVNVKVINSLPTSNITSNSKTSNGAELIAFLSAGTPAAGASFSIDNLTIKEIYGNHATQSVTASRPVLSARKNVLLATETLATQSITSIAAQYTLSFTGTGSVTLSGTATGTLTGTGVNDRVSLTVTPTAGTLTLTVSGSVTKAQLELGTSAGPYQRINTATDYDTDPRYFPKYLRFDGVDDYLNLPWMNLAGSVSGTTTVVAMDSRSASAGVSYVLSEKTTYSPVTVYGPMYLAYGLSHRVFMMKDNGQLLDTGYGVTPDRANVFSVTDDMTNITQRKNGVIANQVAFSHPALITNNTLIGAGNHGGIVSNFGLFNLYGMIITKSALTDAQRIACERHLSRKAGVAL